MIVKFCYACMVNGIIAHTVLLDSGNVKDALRHFKYDLHDVLLEHKITLTEENVLRLGKKTLNIF